MPASYCPICGAVELVRVMDTVEMKARFGREAKTSTGLQAFQCANAHVFFLRAADAGLFVMAAAAR